MFKYNNKIWNPKNPQKKLKQLGITWNDVEIIQPKIKKENIEYEDPHRLFYYINRKTGYSISSIYPTCNELDYEPITYEDLLKFYEQSIETTLETLQR